MDSAEITQRVTPAAIRSTGIRTIRAARGSRASSAIQDPAGNPPNRLVSCAGTTPKWYDGRRSTWTYTSRAADDSFTTSAVAMPMVLDWGPAVTNTRSEVGDFCGASTKGDDGVAAVEPLRPGAQATRTSPQLTTNKDARRSEFIVPSVPSAMSKAKCT